LALAALRHMKAGSYVRSYWRGRRMSFLRLLSL